MGRPNAERDENVTSSRPVRAAAERALMNAELTRELIERYEFGVPRMHDHRRSGSLEHVWGSGSQSAVPHPKRVQGDVDERGQRLLRQIGGTQFAQRSHDRHTMPRERGVVKRPPAYQAGDHDALTEHLPCAKRYDGRKRAGK